LFLFIAPSVTH